MDDRKHIYIFDLFEDADVDFNDFYNSERKILNPLLINNGYKIERPWWTSEGDSFGPLSRSCRCTSPEGETVIFFYD